MKINTSDPRLHMAHLSQPNEIKSNDQKLNKAASEFEAMLFQEMLKSMRQADEPLIEDSPLSSRETSFIRDWRDAELAKDLAGQGGVGLAEQLARQVRAIQGPKDGIK